jgi:hypothetical protein
MGSVEFVGLFSYVYVFIYIVPDSVIVGSLQRHCIAYTEYPLYNVSLVHNIPVQVYMHIEYNLSVTGCICLEFELVYSLVEIHCIL